MTYIKNATELMAQLMPLRRVKGLRISVVRGVHTKFEFEIKGTPVLISVLESEEGFRVMLVKTVGGKYFKCCCVSDVLRSLKELT